MIKKKAAKKKKTKQYPDSRMLKRMERIEKMIDDIKESEKVSEGVGKKIEKSEKRIEKTSKKIFEEETEIEKIGKKVLEKEKDIEKTEKSILEKEGEIKEALVKIAMFTFRKDRILELARGVAGAFIGVAIGFGLIITPQLASVLAWQNVIGILILILGISAILIYKNKKEGMDKEGMSFVVKRLVTLYIICICIEAVTLLLFGALSQEVEILAKTLIIGSYPAMAGAVAFTIVK